MKMSKSLAVLLMSCTLVQSAFAIDKCGVTLEFNGNFEMQDKAFYERALRNKGYAVFPQALANSDYAKENNIVHQVVLTKAQKGSLEKSSPVQISGVGETSPNFIGHLDLGALRRSLKDCNSDLSTEEQWLQVNKEELEYLEVVTGENIVQAAREDKMSELVEICGENAERCMTDNKEDKEKMKTLGAMHIYESLFDESWIDEERATILPQIEMLMERFNYTKLVKNVDKNNKVVAELSRLLKKAIKSKVDRLCANDQAIAMDCLKTSDVHRSEFSDDKFEATINRLIRR